MDKSASTKDVCFVVSPIGQKGSAVRTHADWVFSGIIEPAFESFPDFKVERSDHINTPGQINSQVIDRLLNSRLVIADLSLLNPNVFYEIGIRHMVEKPIIHLQREDDSIPFDVAIYRSLIFSLKEHADLKTAQGQLVKMIGEVLEPGYVANNPVIEARGRVKLKETATPEQQILLEDMARLKSRVEFLEIARRSTNIGADPLQIIAPVGYFQSKEANNWIKRANLLSNFDPNGKGYITIVTKTMSQREIDSVVKFIIDNYNRTDDLLVDKKENIIQIMGPMSELRTLSEILPLDTGIDASDVIFHG